MQDEVKVTQADRDAAIQALNAAERQRSFGGNGTVLGQVAETFARHRQQAERGEDWRPIETAPKDGTVIDVWIEGEFPGRRTDVSWREPSDSEWWIHGGDTIETPNATWHDCFGPLGSCEQPTHWQPLPTPPEAAA